MRGLLLVFGVLLGWRGFEGVVKFSYIKHLKHRMLINQMYLHTLSPFFHTCFTAIGHMLNVNNTVPSTFSEYNGKSSNTIYLSDGERNALADKIVGIRVYDFGQKILLTMLLVPVAVIVAVINLCCGL